MISIIIPVYNSEKTLSRCLDSVLAQDYEDIEIITVNDGSTDNSQIILKYYQLFKLMMLLNSSEMVLSIMLSF